MDIKELREAWRRSPYRSSNGVIEFAVSQINAVLDQAIEIAHDADCRMSARGYVTEAIRELKIGSDDVDQPIADIRDAANEEMIIAVLRKYPNLLASEIQRSKEINGSLWHVVKEICR